MKIIFFTILSLFIFEITHSQVTGIISSAAGQPVPFANVSLLKSNDSSFVKGVATNQKGTFSISYNVRGTYILQVTSTGYQSWSSAAFELDGGQTIKNFGTLVLKEDAKELGTVTVRSEKPLVQQKPEGIIVNVENSLLTKGSSALEVLERSPGVVINHRDNSIELNGKSGVMVMLNGKLMRMSMEQVVSLLNGMSADDIASIELLTTPPAKYDAEGSAGLINIVLKKNKKRGTNGSASVTTGYGQAEKGTANLNLAHNTKNINLFGSYTFSHNKPYSNMFVDSWQNMPFMGGNVHVTGWFNTRAISNNHDASLGFETTPGSKTTVGASVNYNNSNLSPANFTDAGYNVLPDSLLQYNGISKGVNHWNNIVSAVYLERKMKEGEKINADINYLYFNNNSHSFVQSSFVDKHGQQAGSDENLFAPGQTGFAHTAIQVGVAKLDYARQLSKKIKLESGFKGTYTQSTSLSGIQSLVNGVWTSDAQTTNHIIMKENIEAAYVSFNWQINPTILITPGLRYEYSYTDMNNSKTGDNIANRKLSAFFPSLFFTKNLNDKSDLQFSYTKRVSRPSYNDLASYVGYSDPTAVYTGNPFLKPTITHNLKIGYSMNGYSFSLMFSRDNNAISRYQLSESPGKNMLFISPQNLTWQNNLTFQTSLPFKINSWWTMTYNFSGGLRQYKAEYTLHPFTQSYFGYNGNFTQAFRFQHSWSAEVSGWYNSTGYYGTQKMKGFGAVNAGLKKDLKNNAGSFQLAVVDVFRSEKYNLSYGTLTEEAFNIKNHVTVYTESTKFPIIKLTYSRSFGNNKTKTQHENSSGDEQDRIRKE